MHGYWRNSYREDYGPGVKGPDFVVEGLGDYQHITHLENKNPVGSKISISNNGPASIVVQGENIGRKLSKQKNFWSNPVKRNTIPDLKQSANFPQSPDNVVGLVDCFDVPVIEKRSIQSSVINGHQSHNSRNLIFLNNVTNI